MGENSVTENKKENKKAGSQAYRELEGYLEQAMAFQTALILLEWDNETLAPEAAGGNTARVQGTLSAAYQKAMTDPKVAE